MLGVRAMAKKALNSKFFSNSWNQEKKNYKHERKRKDEEKYWGKLTCLEICTSKSLRLAEEEVGLILTEQRCYYPLAECFCPHCRYGQAHSPVF